MRDVKNGLYKWFNDKGFKTRDAVRLAVCPVEGVNPQIVEGYFSEYKKDMLRKGIAPTKKVISISDLHIPFF